MFGPMAYMAVEIDKPLTSNIITDDDEEGVNKAEGRATGIIHTRVSAKALGEIEIAGDLHILFAPLKVSDGAGHKHLTPPTRDPRNAGVP